MGLTNDTDINILPEPPQDPDSGFLHKLKRFGAWLKDWRIILILLGGFLGTLATIYLINFYRPQSLQFSYSGDNCITLPLLFPGSLQQNPSQTYRLEPLPKYSIGKTVVYSHTSCLRTTDAPPQNDAVQLTLSLPALPGAHKTVRVTSNAYPRVIELTELERPLSSKDNWVLRLSQADRIFTYQVIAGDKRAPCPEKDGYISCDVASLGLPQGAHVELAVERNFQGRPAGITFVQSVRTVEPVQVIGSSIAPGQTIYDIPTEIVLTLNKPAQTIRGGKLTATTQNSQGQTEEYLLSVTPSAKDKTLTLKFTKPLPRNTPMKLILASITSLDGGYLPTPYELNFTMSGGPKVTRTNIGSYKVPSGQAIVLTFDSNLAPGQNLSELIKLEAGGQTSATVTASGNQATIRPPEFGPCTSFTVRVSEGLKNEFGITGGTGWSYGSRTTCQQIFSIGTSTRGRAITAYRFGSGANRIVYVGGTHGNEKSSVYIMNRWIESLEAGATRIPARSSIIVIPNLNPDAYASGTRTNARNVDLNRNFPSYNWKSGVTMPDKSYNPTGGGTSSLSEPESSAIASYLNATRPRLVLTYHATGSVVIPNDTGDSVAIALQYAKNSSVYFASNAQTGAIFEYDTTGAMEDWLHDKVGITTLLVELDSLTSNDFSGHSNALWWTAGL